MLTAAEITVRLGRGEIEWSGLLRGDSLLLELGSPIQPLVESEPDQLVDLASPSSISTLYNPPQHEWTSYDLAPGRLALCQARLPLRLAVGLAAAMSTLSHLARVGLTAHLTSPLVMPGWSGYLTFELFNAAPVTLRLWQGMPVARLVIFCMTSASQSPSHHPYYGRNCQLASRYADEFYFDR